MAKATRRDFLQRTVLGLAGVGAAGLVLRRDAQPTLATVSGDEANRVLIQMGAIPKEVTSAKGELKQLRRCVRALVQTGRAVSGQALVAWRAGNDFCSVGPRLGI